MKRFWDLDLWKSAFLTRIKFDRNLHVISASTQICLVILLLNIEPTIEIVVYDVTSNDYPKMIKEVHGYIISGSKRSVYEEISWIKQLGKFFKELHEKKKKLVDICFGHQLVAHFGVEKLKNLIRDGESEYMSLYSQTQLYIMV